jgi:hypothetical protein
LGLLQVFLGIMPQDADSVANFGRRRNDALADVIADRLGGNTEDVCRVHHRVEGLAINDDHKEAPIPSNEYSPVSVTNYLTLRTMSTRNMWVRVSIIEDNVKIAYGLLK